MVAKAYICKSLWALLTLKRRIERGGDTKLIKCSGEGNLSDMRHFNTPLHVWQLMAKHVDNNGRERPIIARNLWL
jgi:hypothetical protein